MVLKICFRSGALLPSLVDADGPPLRFLFIWLLFRVKNDLISCMLILEIWNEARIWHKQLVLVILWSTALSGTANNYIFGRLQALHNVLSLLGCRIIRRAKHLSQLWSIPAWKITSLCRLIFLEWCNFWSDSQPEDSSLCGWQEEQSDASFTDRRSSVAQFHSSLSLCRSCVYVHFN